jgi:hypothetical protein
MVFISIKLYRIVIIVYNFFFTQEGTQHVLRFVLHCFRPQETVGEAGIEPGTAAWRPGITWTNPLSYHIPGGHK